MDNCQSKLNKISYSNIQQLVDNFYKEVVKDPDLGPVFIQKIGENKEDWDRHLATMSNFWSDMMLSTSKYRRNVIKPHMDLPKFDIKLFDIWLGLFSKAVKDMYEDELVELFEMKSARVAHSLKLALYFKPNFKSRSVK